jgi:four helix bundle protein
VNKILFDHEKLNVYQNALDFVEWIDKKILAGRKKLSVYDQIDRASTSIPLNIAEGNGKYSSKDRCRYFDIARGSALECASCLDVLHLKDLLELSKKDEGKEKLRVIVSMLIGLIKSNSNRSYEKAVKYSSKQK